MPSARRSGFRRRGYLWVTLGFFVVTIVGHWLFAWFAYIDEQEAHARPVDPREYVVETARDTLENWQSEFLQLIWQVAGLALLLYVGSPQSKESDERLEAKLDALLRGVRPSQADELIRSLEERFPKR